MEKKLKKKKNDKLIEQNKEYLIILSLRNISNYMLR